MKKTLILPLLLALSLPAPADPVDDFAQAELERQKIPGLAVGIYRNGNIVKQQGYGLANVEHQIPVSADTVFQTASIGKMFAAAAVMLLVEDGKIRLDQSVRTYLPEAPKSWQPITIRHLLNHTGGIGNTETDWQQNSSEKHMLRRIYAAPLQFKPGSRWAYSNNGYALLGAVITRVSGKHYGEILQERVFAPLGMTSARVISERDIVPHRAAGYELDDADGSPMSGHPGAWQGFSTELRRYEGDGTAIVVLTNLAGVDTETIIEGIAARTNPRYQKTHAPIADQHPALTRDFERVLLLVKQGKPHPAVPKGRLKDLHAKFADAGKCQALPTRHQNNGDIQERDYRVICERRSFEGNADFVKGKTVRLWLEETVDDAGTKP